MKVTITRPVSCAALGSFAPGDTPDLPTAESINLIGLRKAVPYVAPASPQAETASAAPTVETAAVIPAAPAAKKRRA